MTSVGSCQARDAPRVSSALGPQSQMRQRGGKEHCHGVLLSPGRLWWPHRVLLAGKSLRHRRIGRAGRLPLQCPCGEGCPYLSPLAGDPAGRGAAPQVAPHAGGGLGGLVALGGGQGHAVVAALAQDDAVAEAGPAARGALQGQGTRSGRPARRGQRQLWLPQRCSHLSWLLSYNIPHSALSVAITGDWHCPPTEQRPQRGEDDVNHRIRRS